MKRIPLALVMLFLAPLLALAQVAVPPLTGHVVDQAAVLSADQARQLERTLSAFEQRKGSQIVVLIVPSTQPETIEQYSIRVAEQWKLGRSHVDDGAILVVARNDRSLRVEVGYGLEGVLSDAVCNRIINEIIVPHFRQGDYSGGISAGVNSITGVVEGEPLPAAEHTPPADEDGGRAFLPLLFFVTLIIAAVTRYLMGRLPGAVVTAVIAGVLAWWLAGVAVAVLASTLAFVFALAGVRAIRGWPGGSGGDFRGGGGRFGGGGASGRW